jgi:hypothetical protein
VLSVILATVHVYQKLKSIEYYSTNVQKKFTPSNYQLKAFVAFSVNSQNTPELPTHPLSVSKNSEIQNQWAYTYQNNSMESSTSLLRQLNNQLQSLHTCRTIQDYPHFKPQNQLKNAYFFDEIMIKPSK